MNASSKEAAAGLCAFKSTLIFSHKGKINGIGVCPGTDWNLFGERGVRDSDFYDLVTMLDQTAGQTHGKEPHAELVELVRTHFPARTAGRYRPLASDLLAAQEDATPLYKINPRYEDNDFNSKFGEARRGNEKRFRALLLKWLWAHHRDEAESYMARWNIRVAVRASRDTPALQITPDDIFNALSDRKLSLMLKIHAITLDDKRQFIALRDRHRDQGGKLSAADMRFLAHTYELAVLGRIDS